MKRFRGRMPTVADVRRIALSLPETSEQETWCDTTFRVRGKIFGIFGPDETGVSVRASLDDQAVLVASEPSTFRPSAYTGATAGSRWTYRRFDSRCSSG